MDTFASGRWVDEQLGRLDIEQKVGQLMVFGMCGPVITPDVVELISRYHLGGLRISQGFRIINLFNDVKPGQDPEEWTLRSLHPPGGCNRDFSGLRAPTRCTPREYAAVLNQLRQLALDRPGAVPLHFTIDQEGSGSDDLLFGTRLLPHPMGLAATGDPEMAYRAARTIGSTARALGINMLHSPVLDVNTNPLNPEVGTRAYGDDPDTVTRFARASLRGFSETGIIATGKHFPGRGESQADAHWGLPVVDLPREELERVHVSPYRELIADGLPAVMMAHCRYPALSDSPDPASCDPQIVRTYLREELGFTGVITTDNMMMGGLLQRYELTEAVLRTLQAGCDLVLLRDESPIRWRILERIVAAVRSGEYPEAMLDAAVERVLRMRHRMGLAENGGLVDPDRADRFDDPAVVAAAADCAAASTLLVRDRAGALPVAPDARVLLVEQIFPTQARANDSYTRPGLLWEEMCAIGSAVGSVEIENVPTAQDGERVRRRLAEDDYDVIVTTNYYYHKAASANTPLVREMLATGKPVIVVTNTPYAFGVPDEVPTAITSFNPGGREHLRVVAEAIYGRRELTARSPLTGGP
ncbi:MAG: glycoside hydrolase family 3 N-terminal domain-containing protein [Planctomycetota bacterium]